MFGTNECARCFIVQVTDSTQVTILFSPSIFNLSHNTFFTQIYSIQFKSQYFYPIQVKILFSPKSYPHQFKSRYFYPGIFNSIQVVTKIFLMRIQSQRMRRLIVISGVGPGTSILFFLFVFNQSLIIHCCLVLVIIILLII